MVLLGLLLLLGWSQSMRRTTDQRGTLHHNFAMHARLAEYDPRRGNLMTSPGRRAAEVAATSAPGETGQLFLDDAGVEAGAPR